MCWAITLCQPNICDILCTSHILTPLTLTSVLWGQHFYCLHFTKEKEETGSGCQTRPRTWKMDLNWNQAIWLHSMQNEPLSIWLQTHKPWLSLCIPDSLGQHSGLVHRPALPPTPAFSTSQDVIAQSFLLPARRGAWVLVLEQSSLSDHASFYSGFVKRCDLWNCPGAVDFRETLWMVCVVTSLDDVIMHPLQTIMHEPPASCKQYNRPEDFKLWAWLQPGLQTYNPNGRVMKWSVIELRGGIIEASNPINIIELLN